MFFVGLTTRDLTRDLASDRVRVIRYDNVIVTTLTDGWLSSLHTSPAELRVVESLPGPNNGPPSSVALAEFVYQAPRGLATLRQEPAFGRPLYYHLSPQGEFFCSSHISLLKKIKVPLEENAAVLPEFFVYRYVMPPQTLYRDIHRVPFGGRLHIEVSPGHCRISRVEGYPLAPDPDRTAGASDLTGKAEAVRESLRQSVTDVAASPDSILFMLSGGLDSSILYRLLETSIGPTETHSTGFSFVHGENDPEMAYAMSSAEAFGAHHRHHRVSREEYLHGFLEAIAEAEEPLLHLQSVLIHVLLKKSASPTKKIVVCGQGADGLFGLGFHEAAHHQRRKWDPLFSRLPLGRLFDLVHLFTGKGRHYVSYRNPYNRIWDLGCYGSRQWVCRNLKTSMKAITANRYRAMGRSAFMSILDAATALDLLGDISLTQGTWSKIGEAQGLVFHFPFCSPRVLDGALAIDWETKLREPKMVLRAVARLLDIPEFILTRPKAGFGLDTRHWSGAEGLLRPFLRMASGIVDRDSIADADSEEYHDAMTLWNIANYAMWKRLCVRGESLTSLKEELSEATTPT